MKVRAVKSIEEWTADVAKKAHPYSKTLKAVDWYFGSVGYDDVNVEWSRAFDGYSNDHYTPKVLADIYRAAKVEIANNFSITIYDN